MCKWVLYFVLFLLLLGFITTSSAEKNKESLINSPPIESKNLSFAGYDMDGSAGSRHLIIVFSALSINENDTNSSFKENQNVWRPDSFLTYEIVVNGTGKVILSNPVLAGLPTAIFTKEGEVPSTIPSPGKLSTPGIVYNISLNNTSNGSGNIMNVSGTVYDQVSPQSNRVNLYEHRIIQPTSPALKNNYSNFSYPGETSHYVGADGHLITLVNNESAVDPSYEQLIDFIKKDKTNEIPYNKTSFVCSDAAERVHNNAEAMGIRAAWVYIDFTNESATLNPTTNALVIGHACNLFNTTDKGLVAIDCTGGSATIDSSAGNDLSEWDNEVSLVKNEEYIPRLLYSFPGSDQLNAFLSMGTIADYYVFW